MEERRTLSRKTSRAINLTDLEIPSFLNDKKESQKKECKQDCQCEKNKLKGI
jgi:hypothetical protein